MPLRTATITSMATRAYVPHYLLAFEIWPLPRGLCQTQCIRYLPQSTSLQVVKYEHFIMYAYHLLQSQLRLMPDAGALSSLNTQCACTCKGIIPTTYECQANSWCMAVLLEVLSYWLLGCCLMSRCIPHLQRNTNEEHSKVKKKREAKKNKRIRCFLFSVTVYV